MTPKPSKKPGTKPAASPSASPDAIAERLRKALALIEEGKRKRVGAGSSVERGALRREINIEDIKFPGEKFTIKFYASNGKLSILKADREAFEGQFGAAFDKAKEVPALAQTYKVFLGDKVSLDATKDMLEAAYMVKYLKKAREEFETKYKHLEEYTKKKGLGTFAVTLTVSQAGAGVRIDLDKKSKQKLSGYEDWVKKNKTDKPKEDPNKGGKKKPSATAKPEENAERKAALARFKQTSLGKSLAMMKDENGRDMLDKIAKGDAPMIIFALLGLLGFKELGGGIWEGLRDVTKGTKIEANLKSLEKKARGSRFAAAKEEDRRLAKFEKYSSQRFGEFLSSAGNGADIPKKGLTLTQSYNFRGTAMKVTVGAGGSMVIPGPANILVNGNRTSVPKGKPRTYSAAQGDTVVEIGGSLPKGTRFEGKITLAAISVDKAKKAKGRGPAAKPAAKPATKLAKKPAVAKAKPKKKATPKKKA